MRRVLRTPLVFACQRQVPQVAPAMFSVNCKFIERSQCSGIFHVFQVEVALFRNALTSENGESKCQDYVERVGFKNLIFFAKNILWKQWSRNYNLSFQKVPKRIKTVRNDASMWKETLFIEVKCKKMKTRKKSEKSNVSKVRRVLRTPLVFACQRQVPQELASGHQHFGFQRD